MRTFLMVRTFDLLFMDYESGKMKLANLQTCGRFHTSHTYMYIIKGIGVSGVVGREYIFTPCVLLDHALFQHTP